MKASHLFFFFFFLIVIDLKHFEVMLNLSFLILLTLSILLPLNMLFATMFSCTRDELCYPICKTTICRITA